MVTESVPRRRGTSRPAVRRLVSAVTVVALVAASAAALGYRRQIVSWLTHRKGGPTTTTPYSAPVEQPLLRIAIAGDTGDTGRSLDRVSAAIADVGAVMPFDVLLLLGDLVYPFGDVTRVDEVVLRPFEPVIREGAELLAILGNHDVQRGQGDAVLAALGMEGRYWARTYGDVLIVGIDSTEIDDPGQLSFLDTTLASTTATWRIIAVHHPPYSAGYQGSSHAVREVLAPITARYGVQLVVSGHDHDYQRSVEIGGTVYLVSGGGSGTRGTGEDEFTAVSWSLLHFVELSVYADRLELRAIDPELGVADQFRIDP